MGVVDINALDGELYLDEQYCVWSQSPEAGKPPLEFSGVFEVAQTAEIDSFGLSALALHLAPSRFDTMDVSVIARETNKILGAWTVPGDALVVNRGWLELRFATPTTARGQTPVIIIKGALAEGGRLCLSRAATAEFDDYAFALQFYRAAPSRALIDAAWRWERIGNTESSFAGIEGAAINIPAKAWLGAKIVGKAKPSWSEDGHLRLRVQNGAAAIVIFSDVALANIASIVAKLTLESGFDCDIALSLALLPVGQGIPPDPAAVDEAALWWAPAQILHDSEESPTFVLPLDAPAYGHVALALRNLGERSDDFALLDCAGLWLLPKAGKNYQSDHELFAVEAPDSVGEAAFEDVRVNETLDNEGYRHLDLTVVALSDLGQYWDRVKFKLYETRNAFGLEFRSGPGFPKIFNVWPGTKSDGFGDFYKIWGLEEFAEAIETLPDLSDRTLLAALRVVLPHLIQQLERRGALEATLAASWMKIALKLRG